MRARARLCLCLCLSLCLCLCLCLCHLSLLDINTNVVFEYNTGTGSTPLAEAMPNGNIEIAKLLLAAGADPSVPNKHGETAHDIAAARKHKELQSLLRDEV